MIVNPLLDRAYQLKHVFETVVNSYIPLAVIVGTRGEARQITTSRARYYDRGKETKIIGMGGMLTGIGITSVEIPN